MLIPPIELRSRLGDFPTPDSWLEAGIATLDELRNEFGLKSNDQVLDLASGCGRVALPLIMFLNRSTGGGYEGLDAAKDMISWCNENLARSYMGFNWADVKNTEYASSNSLPDSAYTFPYNNNSFSFGFACSLFTHMLSAGTKQYLKEISRVLKPKGRFMVSVFLIDNQAEDNLKKGKSIFEFAHLDEDPYCRYNILARPEAQVAFGFNHFINMANDVGLLLEKFKRGTWSDGIKNWCQDEIMFIKEQ